MKKSKIQRRKSGRKGIKKKTKRIAALLEEEEGVDDLQERRNTNKDVIIPVLPENELSTIAAMVAAEMKKYQPVVQPIAEPTNVDALVSAEVQRWKNNTRAQQPANIAAMVTAEGERVNNNNLSMNLPSRRCFGCGELGIKVWEFRVAKISRLCKL